jgi:hypothetical protein
MEVDKPEEEGAWRDEEDWKVSPECSTCLVNNGNGKRDPESQDAWRQERG